MVVAPSSQDPKQLKICIIGAGMGGLSTALSLAKAGFDNIHVYEHAPGLGFVGAGIQLAANMARILDRLGIWDEVRKEAVLIDSNSIREGETDSELGRFDFRSIGERYDYPHMVGHRASLANALYGACLREKAVTFHLGSPVSQILEFEPRPSFTVAPFKEDPYRVETDVLLAADGIKSFSRASMLKHLGITGGEIKETGQAAYRILVPRESMAKDPELEALIDAGCVTRWIGEKRHIIAYPISSNELYNISTVQPDVNFAGAPSTTWTTGGSKKEMLQVFGDFCPKVLRMLDLVPDSEVVEWKLQVHSPLPTWVSGSVALIGDAAHPTLPHLGQGAAMAIEDGAVLGVVLSSLPDARPETVNRGLRVYEMLRRDRTSTLVQLAHENGKLQHLGEGEAKAQRDAQWKAVREGRGGPVPEKWAESDVQDMIYGVDVVSVAEREAGRLFTKATGEAQALTTGVGA